MMDDGIGGWIGEQTGEWTGEWMDDGVYCRR